MRRKYLCLCVAAVTLLLLNLEASAQVGPLSGQVSMKLEGGETVPLEGAAVDVFRTDLPSRFRTTTDKEGRFIFAGLPYAGTYLLAVSAPNAQPKAISNAKAGREIEYRFILEQGDGRRLTLEEASATAEADRVTEAPDEILNRAFKAGNVALSERHFDEAIKQYDEGISADPTRLKVAPLLVNKSVALRSRATDRYNTAVFYNGKPQNPSLMEAVSKDLREAAELGTEAVEMIKGQPMPTDETALRSYESSKNIALAARAEAMRMLAGLVDPKQADDAFSAFQEYIETITDPHRKSEKQLDAARMLLDAKLTDRAVEEFQRILTAEPENVDAMFGLGLALYRSGDKARFPEAATYLERFVESAPQTHPMLGTAREVVRKLKTSK